MQNVIIHFHIFKYAYASGIARNFCRGAQCGFTILWMGCEDGRGILCQSYVSCKGATLFQGAIITSRWLDTKVVHA